MHSVVDLTRESCTISAVGWFFHWLVVSMWIDKQVESLWGKRYQHQLLTTASCDELFWMLRLKTAIIPLSADLHLSERWQTVEQEMCQCDALSLCLRSPFIFICSFPTIFCCISLAPPNVNFFLWYFWSWIFTSCFHHKREIFFARLLVQNMTCVSQKTFIVRIYLA